jgi:hypothetical protein
LARHRPPDPPFERARFLGHDALLARKGRHVARRSGIVGEKLELGCLGMLAERPREPEHGQWAAHPARIHPHDRRVGHAQRISNSLMLRLA